MSSSEEDSQRSVPSQASQSSSPLREEEEDGEQQPESPQPADEHTLRVMLSTDNHLGYCERDPVRGLDSFAAFEEVLWLAKEQKCDFVLIAGDLFHDNKPSRRTMHKTMEILRRYSMGPDPVPFKILSDQTTNFRSVHGTVNYEDEFYSVDLPVFSIHGNHDDPTRDGGTEMFAALDLLAVSNLVNYFGRQDEVDKVEVSPILMQKGNTKVALYGMGSMRDERLNRMWQGKKVRFLRPESQDEQGGEEEEQIIPWFNIFALHQNRDLGRGVKNCVHESMIPEWMDLIVSGHEHECRIEPQESVIGTFRITQPGSSVATSLTGGEAVRKQVGILEIKENQFRLTPIPLTQIRSFVMGEISLKDQAEQLDPEDPNIDRKVTELLEDEVRVLIHEAREKTKELSVDARDRGNTAMVAAAETPYFGSSSSYSKTIKYKLEKPNEVLVRLKVEHSGFTTMNNQRFGAKFVGQVANPSDILLFHRRREQANRTGGVGTGKSKTKRGTSSSALDGAPIAPDELEEMNIEDLVKDHLESAENKLEVLDESRMGLALDEFVSKEQNKALTESFENVLDKQQKILLQRRPDGNTYRDSVKQESQRVQAKQNEEKEQQQQQQQQQPKVRRKKAASKEFDNDKGSLSDSDDMEVVVTAPPKKGRAKPTTKSSLLSRQQAATSTKRRKSVDVNRDGNSDIYMDESISSPTSRRTPPRPRRKATNSQVNYHVNGDKNDGNESDSVVEIPDGDDDDDIQVVNDARFKKRSRSTTIPSATPSSQRQAPSPKLSQSQLSFTSGSSTNKRRGTTIATNRQNTKRATTTYYDDDSDDDNDHNDRGKRGIADSIGMAAGWGSAGTISMRESQRNRKK